MCWWYGPCADGLQHWHWSAANCCRCLVCCFLLCLFMPCGESFQGSFLGFDQQKEHQQKCYEPNRKQIVQQHSHRRAQKHCWGNHQGHIQVQQCLALIPRVRSQKVDAECCQRAACDCRLSQPRCCLQPKAHQQAKQGGQQRTCFDIPCFGQCCGHSKCNTVQMSAQRWMSSADNS